MKWNFGIVDTVIPTYTFHTVFIITILSTSTFVFSRTKSLQFFTKHQDIGLLKVSPVLKSELF